MRKPLLTVALLATFVVVCGGRPSVASLPSEHHPLAFDGSSKKGKIASAAVPASELPPEARQTLRLIKQGGPYPHDKDGSVFGNREQRLPAKGRGYYHEFTVKTPGARDRGARRIIAGANGEFYYTADHYNTFKRILE